jgi:hypothetical protein
MGSTYAGHFLTSTESETSLHWSLKTNKRMKGNDPRSKKKIIFQQNTFPIHSHGIDFPISIATSTMEISDKHC